MKGKDEKKQIIISFILLTALAFIVRFNLATYVRTCLSGEEAVVGVMAYHIEDRGEHPVFTYCGPYNGGMSIEAHGAAIFNAAFGRSALNARLPVILSFAFFAGISMLLGIRAIGALPGIFVGLHIIFSPQFHRVSLSPIGYMEVLTIMALCCCIVYTRMMGEPGNGAAAAAKEQAPPPITWGVLLGLLSGAAYWGLEFSAMMTAALFVAYGLRWRIKAFPVLLGWAISFPLGAVPTIIYNLNNDFLNFRHLAKGHLLTSRAFSAFFTKELPALFQNDNIGLYLLDTPWFSWLLFIATALGCLLAIYFSIKNKRSGSGILLFGLLYCIFYGATYLASPFRGESPRHLLPLEPFLSLGLVAGITALLKTRKAAARCLAAALILSVVTADVGGTLYALKDNTVDIIYDMDVECDAAYGQIDRLTSALEERGISHVYTNRYEKWMILFRTEEKIKAADVNLLPQVINWTEYEDIALDADNPAYYFNVRDPHAPWLKAYLNAHGIPFHYTHIAHYALIQPVSRVSHVEFINWCNRTYKARKSHP